MPLYLEHRCSELRVLLGRFFSFAEYEVSFLIFFDNFRLKVYCILYKNGYASLFLGTTCLENCFPAFYSEIVSVFVTDVGFFSMQQNVGSFISIQSVSLYLSIEEFSPLILRGNKDYYYCYFCC